MLGAFGTNSRLLPTLGGRNIPLGLRRLSVLGCSFNRIHGFARHVPKQILGRLGGGFAGGPPPRLRRQDPWADQRPQAGCLGVSCWLRGTLACYGGGGRLGVEGGVACGSLWTPSWFGGIHGFATHVHALLGVHALFGVYASTALFGAHAVWGLRAGWGPRWNGSNMYQDQKHNIR